MNPFSALIDLIIPRICHICERKLPDSEKFICHTCAAKLPATGYHLYWGNSTGLNTDLNPMEQRFAGQLPLDHACSPFFYTRDSSLARLVHDFKYRGFSDLAVTLGVLGARLLEGTDFFRGTDMLIPIPLHWRKKMRRGYNQSEMLARGLSKVTDIPLCNNLRAARGHRTQTSLSHQQRLDNTKGIFKVVSPHELEGKTVMLVDDICTTGATLLSAGETITASVKNARLKIFTLGVV